MSRIGVDRVTGFWNLEVGSDDILKPPLNIEYMNHATKNSPTTAAPIHQYEDVVSISRSIGFDISIDFDNCEDSVKRK